MAARIFTMLAHGLRLRCPRCGTGRLYGKPFRMHDRCAHCTLKFEREQGYFIGAIYINYAATIAIAVPGFFLLDAFTHITINQQLALWIPFAVVFPLLFFHHSRSLWLMFDHFFNPEKQLFSVPPKKKTKSDYLSGLEGIFHSRTSAATRATLPPGSAWTRNKTTRS